MTDYRNPKNSKGQVERLARLYHRRLHAAIGASLTVEDLEQEFWIVWHIVCQRFDPTKGFEFKAFLGVSIRNKALELARRSRRRLPLAAESLDREIQDDRCLKLVDLVEDEAAEQPEDRVIRMQERERLLEEIDPRLRRMVELLENTPPDIERQVNALRAKAAYAESLGLSMRAPKDVTLSMLSEMMGVSRCVRYKMIEKMQENIADD